MLLLRAQAVGWCFVVQTNRARRGLSLRRVFVCRWWGPASGGAQMTPEQTTQITPAPGDETGDYYLYCDDWPGRIFIELARGAFLIADGPDGEPILQRVEPYRGQLFRPRRSSVGGGIAESHLSNRFQGKAIIQGDDVFFRFLFGEPLLTKLFNVRARDDRGVKNRVNHESDTF